MSVHTLQSVLVRQVFKLEKSATCTVLVESLASVPAVVGNLEIQFWVCGLHTFLVESYGFCRQTAGLVTLLGGLHLV